MVFWVSLEKGELSCPTKSTKACSGGFFLPAKWPDKLSHGQIWRHHLMWRCILLSPLVTLIRNRTCPTTAFATASPCCSRSSDPTSPRPTRMRGPTALINSPKREGRRCLCFCPHVSSSAFANYNVLLRASFFWCCSFCF